MQAEYRASSEDDEKEDDDEDKDEDEDEEESFFKKYAKGFNEEVKSGAMLQPVSDHPDWKWVMMWNGWKHQCDYTRRSKYCDPDRFDMDLYNDWKGWGLSALAEELVSHSPSPPTVF